MTRSEIYKAIAATLSKLCGVAVSLSMITENDTLLCTYDGQDEAVLETLRHAGRGTLLTAEYDPYMNITMFMYKVK